MGYVDDSLLPGEVVIHRTRLHAIVVFLPAICTLLTTGLLIPWLIVAVLNRNNSEFAVTSRRIIAKVGILRRRSLEIFLDRVEGVSIDQGMFGRMLGYGTVVVRGTGGTKELFTRVIGPGDLRRAVNFQVEAARKPTATA